MRTTENIQTMQGVTKTAPGYDNMTLETLEVPVPKEDEILIEVAFTGICGSDIHTFKGEYKNPTTPVVLGHEFSGRVAQVGSAVTHFQPMDRVTSETTFYVCGECSYCQEEKYNLCPYRKGIGTQQNGSLARYVIAKEKYAHKLPENLSYEGAAMSEPLSCCVHAMYQRSPLGLHDTILVMGPGPIGLLLIQIAKEIGATVIATGISKDRQRLELAQKLGADAIVDTQTQDLAEIVNQMTNNVGVTKIYDASGSAAAVNQAFPLIRKGGDFVQVGLFKDKFEKLDVETIIQREIHYIGSRSQNPYDWPIALHLLAKGAIDVSSLVTKKVPLEKWRSAFESVMSGEEIKVMIQSDGDFS
ncbi:galactitol-1-phosphate 5-dehydrogenase [Tetragenococcus muriaticus PMC-11-5]|uniref:Galactitol-1-phosphate 5-dehydrogenase n=1 Tax=Tetragenococcus muriaticus PMC-11-5 TaxID=1302649 RepID=A0A091CAM7_9ENTE|nr:zinc-binding dehydrogenase [Tetragenococcus muriaticus]KFN93727.1 galactitol-1-phosphate 5-dehydrogenase [Tetragenococcus muriaticus PMC-11-5]